MTETCRSWLYIGLIVVFFSLFFTYKTAGVEQGTMWTPGGSSWNQSYGSHLSSATYQTKAKAGYQTNYHAYIFLPIAGLLAYFAGASAPAKRQKRIAWIVAVLTAVCVFITKDSNYAGTGFYLGLVGLGCTIFGLVIARRLAKQAVIKPTNSPAPSPAPPPLV